MQSLYIYSVLNTVPEAESVVVLFCPEESIDQVALKSELKKYFQKYILPDKLMVIGGEYLEKELQNFFIDNVEETFLNVNKIYKPDLVKSIDVFSFNVNGELRQLTNNKVNINVCHRYIQEGLIKIFKNRGGVIEANQGQHFVFPSGKHSTKFLRTGNILLYSSEIYFICFTMLKFFDVDEHKYIYCDTSSINSLAMALVNLKQRFLQNKLKMPLINSFKSYSIFEEEELAFGKNSLFLVSSSTSGGIIERFTERKVSIPLKNIVLLFFLGDADNYSKFQRNIVCNLTYSSSVQSGIEPFKTFNIENSVCKYCQDGSMPLNVIGDTFLSEKPRINKVLLTVFHPPKNLSSFVEQFICDKRNEKNIIKCNFKESPNPDQQYDIYIDINQIFDSILNGEGRYFDYDKKLRKRINLNIPSNTKFIVTVDDSGSKKLGKLILSEFEKTHKVPPKIVSQNEILDKLENIEGSVVIACSSMVNGGNLLYISKALRSFDQLSVVYLIGLVRTKDEQYHDFLLRNLSQGSTLGNSNSPFVAIEKLNLPEKYTNTTWLDEKIFLGKIIAFLENKVGAVTKGDNKTKLYSEKTLLFYSDRLKHLKSVDNKNKGLSNGLFYPNIYNNDNELQLNKNFAFLSFEQYYDRISQAEVYFIISAILNNLRSNVIKGSTLQQRQHDRNVLDPGNFLRFNDGIIQACLLRSALACELDYSLDENLSSQMKDIVMDIITNNDIIMRESIMEFAYAIAIKKVKFIAEHFEMIKKEFLRLDSELISIMFEKLDKV